MWHMAGSWAFYSSPFLVMRLWAAPMIGVYLRILGAELCLSGVESGLTDSDKSGARLRYRRGENFVPKARQMLFWAISKLRCKWSTKPDGTGGNVHNAASSRIASIFSATASMVQ